MTIPAELFLALVECDACPVCLADLGYDAWTCPACRAPIGQTVLDLTQMDDVQ